MKRRIVLLGPPASGKGTQAEMIQARWGIPVTSPGAMLREEKRAGTALGEEADRLTSKGMLVPDAMVVSLVERWLEEERESFLFDGFPRTSGQAEALERILADRGSGLDVALTLDVELPLLEERVRQRRMCSKCGKIVSLGLHVHAAQNGCPVCGGSLYQRSDDTVETLRRRMSEYEAKTLPVSDFYEKRGLLRRVQSAESPEVVFERIAAILES